MKQKCWQEYTFEEKRRFGEELEAEHQRADEEAAPLLACTFAEHALVESGLPVAEDDRVDSVMNEDGVLVPTLVRAINVN